MTEATATKPKASIVIDESHFLPECHQEKCAHFESCRVNFPSQSFEPVLRTRIDFNDQVMTTTCESVEGK